MKSTSTSMRIEKAMDCPQQRYDVSGGLTSEPKVKAIRHGAEVAFNSSSLKTYNEDCGVCTEGGFEGQNLPQRRLEKK